MDLLSKSNTKTAKGFQQMSKIVTITVVLLGVILALAACGGQDSQTPLTATWIKAQVAGDTVSIPVSEVNDNKVVHFNIAVSLGSEMAFMAYSVDEQLNVRANVCPPCRSIGFSLSKDTLICDTYRATFEAKTGEGISGACVDYPKAAVPYKISDGKIVMMGNDLLSAYQNTMESGMP